MSVKNIRKYLDLFEEDNPFYTNKKPDLNKLDTPTTTGFQSYLKQTPVWEYPEWQKEIWVKHRDKIVYEPYGSRTLGSVDWQETLRLHPELGKLVPPELGKEILARLNITPNTTAGGGRGEINPPFVSPDSAAATPPASSAKPPASSAKPPESGTKPPESGTKPPESGTKPPASGTKPPASGTKPSASGTSNNKPGKAYDRVGDDNQLKQSQALLAKLKTDFKLQFNKELVTNSEERTREKQQDLYNRWKKGEHGIYIPTDPKIYPDAKWFHLNSFDASPSNINAEEEAWLKSQGWIRTNKLKDPVHYAYISPPLPLPNKTEKPNFNRIAQTKDHANELRIASQKLRQEAGAASSISNADRLKAIKENRLAQCIIESFGYRFEADKPLKSQYQAVLDRMNKSDTPDTPDTSSIQGEPRKQSDTKGSTSSASGIKGQEPPPSLKRQREIEKQKPSGTGAWRSAARGGGVALSALGTAMSIQDIYTDIRAGDYATAVLEVASNLAWLLGIPLGPSGLVAGSAASIGLSYKAQENREKRSLKQIEEAKKLLQQCQETLDTGKTADGVKLAPETKKDLQTCVDNAKATIATLQNK